MRFFSFRSLLRPTRSRRAPAVLRVESLEGRCLPSATISGYVYNDANFNGIRDLGEAPILNARVELHNTTGGQDVIVGVATTDANGYYQFTTNATINTSPQTLVRSITYPLTPTNFTMSRAIGQFDPSLGQLVSVDVESDATITSDIRVENTSTQSISTIDGTVAGTLTLTGPGGLSLVNQPSANAGEFDATTFDGTKDFAGTSGINFGSQNASNTATTTLTGAALTPFIGTGTVNLLLSARATSNASGGGNLDASITSSALATVRLVYHYIPSNALQPGTYRVVQTPPPGGYLDGLESQGNTVIPGSLGTDAINVQLSANGVSANNNFGKVITSSLSGFVYGDISSGGYNDGIREMGEPGIPNTTITLTGTTNAGTSVSQTLKTDPNGFYILANLYPGTYQLQATQPAGWLPGKDTIGTQGGISGNNGLSNIALPQNDNGLNNNFGELQPVTSTASLSGWVYEDMSVTGYNDGIRELGEPGIPNTTIILTGTDYTGNAVSQTTTTDANGFYSFSNLAAGTYALREVQPAGFLEGKSTIGTPGGSTFNGAFTNIHLAAGYNGQNNNFGELLPSAGRLSSLSGFVYADDSSGGYNDGVRQQGEPGIAGVTITLTGTTNQGQSMTAKLTTDPNGFYIFGGLQAGTYQLQETQPAGWLNGKAAIGTQSGVVGSNVLSAIPLPGGVNGLNNNFAELPAAVKATAVPPVFLTPQFAPVQLLGKNNYFTTPGTNYQDPTIQADATYVDGLYRTLAGRPATYQELGNWVNQLLNGLSLSQVAAAVWNTPEHRRIEVNSFYDVYLGRLPTDAEAAPWVNYLVQTGDEVGVAAAILGSPEYLQRAGGTTTGFVTALYANTQGTDLVPAGAVAYWQNVLSSTGNNYALVARQFLNTDAAAAFIVDAYYRQILQRPPGAGEVNAWVGLIHNGQNTLFNVGIQFVASAEFFATAKKAS